MQFSQLTVLGIDPGSRQIGISVFCSCELVFVAVKTIKTGDESETLKKMDGIVNRLISEFEINHIALEKNGFVQQNWSFVENVLEEIRDIAEKRKISYSEYDPKVVRQIICNNQKPTKANTIRALAKMYPELVRYARASKPWQIRYYSQLFGAIAVGWICLHEFNKN